MGRCSPYPSTTEDVSPVLTLGTMSFPPQGRWYGASRRNAGMFVSVDVKGSLHSMPATWRAGRVT